MRAYIVIYQQFKFLHIRIFVFTNNLHKEGNAKLLIYKHPVYTIPTNIHKIESLRSNTIIGLIKNRQKI